ncbi:MAG: hypothetical protein ACRCUT_01820 [Spirochaetota bacterium]
MISAVIRYLSESMILSAVWLASWIPFLLLSKRFSSRTKYLMLMTILFLLPVLPFIKSDSVQSSMIAKSFHGISTGGFEKAAPQIDPGPQALPLNGSRSEAHINVPAGSILVLVWLCGIIILGGRYLCARRELKKIKDRSEKWD